MNLLRHGEVILQPVDALPKDAKIIKSTHEHIVAHSETGHHHILEVKDKVNMSKFTVYAWNNDTYIEVPQIAELWHQKTGSHVHTTHQVQPAIYKVVLKREYDYYAKVIRQVRD